MNTNDSMHCQETQKETELKINLNPVHLGRSGTLMSCKIVPLAKSMHFLCKSALEHFQISVKDQSSLKMMVKVSTKISI